MELSSRNFMNLNVTEFERILDLLNRKLGGSTHLSPKHNQSGRRGFRKMHRRFRGERAAKASAVSSPPHKCFFNVMKHATLPLLGNLHNLKSGKTKRDILCPRMGKLKYLTGIRYFGK